MNNRARLIFNFLPYIISLFFFLQPGAGQFYICYSFVTAGLSFIYLHSTSCWLKELTTYGSVVEDT